MMKIKKENLYFVLLDLYLIIQVFSESQLNTLPFLAGFLSEMRLFILLFLMIYAALTLGANAGSGISVKKCFTCAFIILCIVHYFLFDGGQSLLGVTLAVVGSMNKSLKKIFKHTLITLTAAHFFVIFLCGIGILSDNVDVRWIGNQTGAFFEGEYVRHAPGFLHSNQIPLIYMLLVFMYVGIRAKRLTVLETVIALLLNSFIFKSCGSRVSFLLVIGFFVCFWLVWICSATFKLRINWLGIGYVIYPFAFVISMVSSYLYNGGAAWKYIDLIFNGRLTLTNRLLQVYPVSLFGYGKYAGTYSGLGNATADNGYILLFLQTGIVLTVMILAMHEYMMHICIKKKYTSLVICLAFVAIENLINAHLPSFKLIPLYCIMLNSEDPFLSQCGSMGTWKIRFIPDLTVLQKKIGLGNSESLQWAEWKNKFRRKHNSHGE